MKKNIYYAIFLITFCISNKVVAQTYTPLVVDSANYVITGDDDFLPPLYMCWGYQILGDSTVNDTIYKKVYRLEFYPTGYQGYPIPDSLFLKNKSFHSLIREENKIIYKRGINLNCPSKYITSSTEWILYDFNINIGDTIDLCINQDASYWSKIVRDTSMITFFSKKYKEYRNTGFIEGIGSKNGLFEYVLIYAGPPFPTLSSYSRGPLSSCNIFLPNIINVESISAINIYPNPATKQITIKINNADNKEYSLQIMNVLGKQILNDKIINEYTVNTSNYSKGIYYINICNKEGKCVGQKVVVE